MINFLKDQPGFWEEGGLFRGKRSSREMTVAREKGNRTRGSCHGELLTCHQFSRHVYPPPPPPTHLPAAPCDQRLRAGGRALAAAADGSQPGSPRPWMCTPAGDPGVLTLQRNSGPASQGRAYQRQEASQAAAASQPFAGDEWLSRRAFPETDRA